MPTAIPSMFPRQMEAEFFRKMCTSLPVGCGVEVCQRAKIYKIAANPQNSTPKRLIKSLTYTGCLTFRYSICSSLHFS